MKKIGQILVEDGIITPVQLQQALEKQKSETEHRRLGEILVDDGVMTLDSLLLYLEHQLKD